MMRSLTFLSLLACFSATVAMDDQNIINISLGRQIMYLGTCVERDRVEKAYGCTFPMNTVFVEVKYEPYDEELYGLDMPYDYIHEKKEGDTILLTVNGKQCTIRCKQLKDRCEEKFEDWLKYSMNRFSKCANWYPAGGKEGEKILISEGVVSENNYGRPQHGKNKSPYVQ